MSKIKRLLVLCVSAVILCFAFGFSACETVAPCAWTYLKMDDGYVAYTSYMYPSGGEHILYFKDQEDAEDKDKAEITISFFPRCLGVDPREVDGETIKTILVDVEKYTDMSFYVYKNTEVFSTEKGVYVNGERLVPTTVYESEYFMHHMFEDITLKRGNPGGHINDEINVIEYR